MSESRHPVDVAAWAERAAQDPVAHRQRQAVELILNAIASEVTGLRWNWICGTRAVLLLLNCR